MDTCMNLHCLYVLAIMAAGVNTSLHSTSAAGEAPAPCIAKMQIVPVHPWRPPFGLDRVGRTQEAVVTFAGTGKPVGEFVLVGYRDGKEVSRQEVVPGHGKNEVRVSVEAGPTEVVLLVKPTAGGEPAEVARQAMTLPPFEADAVARPESVIHPVDLGTILVPHDWLLLAGGQKATVEVAAMNRGADAPGAHAIAWYESVPGEKAAVQMPLKPGEKPAPTPRKGTRPIPDPFDI